MVSCKHRPKSTNNFSLPPARKIVRDDYSHIEDSAALLVAHGDDWLYLFTYHFALKQHQQCLNLCNCNLSSPPRMPRTIPQIFPHRRIRLANTRRLDGQRARSHSRYYLPRPRRVCLAIHHHHLLSRGNKGQNVG